MVARMADLKIADPSIVVDMTNAVLERQHPAVTRWNRLEGRPRAHNFDRALKAEVRDALWMLAKQWQMGEFQGDDAGSPVLARACIDVMKIDRYQAAGGPVEQLSLAEPLEARVERRPLPLRADAQYLSLDLRLAAGRRWMMLLKREAPPTGGLSADYRAAYLGRYKVKTPNPNSRADAAICAHPDAYQQVSAAAERLMDGIALLEHLDEPSGQAFDGIGAVAADQPKLAALADELRAWLDGLIYQPPAGRADAWLPERLEYQFGVSAQDGVPPPGDHSEDHGHELVMRADEYHGGHLDWYALERRSQEEILGKPPQERIAPGRQVHTFLPAPVVFEGMPSTRWWAFEDRRTNFGEVKPDSTDLGKLLLMEFALVYANDWFVLPYTLPVGSVAEAKGIAVSNVFDERFWIEPVREALAADWSRWRMFQLSTPEAERQQPPARLVLLPTTPQIQESAAIEEVALIRDEMANMVWGIEKRIPLPSGQSRPGGEAAREFFDYLQKPLREKVKQMQARKAKLEAIPEDERTQDDKDKLAQIVVELKKVLPPDPAASIRYQVMNTVPEEWIPFIPVHVGGSVREVQLQRAALPRLLPNTPVGTFEKVRPRTSLLRQNLPKGYFLHEEEVPRAGVVVSQSYQRTRWMSGKVFTWFGVRKQTGRGEGSSGLRFDGLIDTKK